MAHKWKSVFYDLYDNEMNPDTTGHIAITKKISAPRIAMIFAAAMTTSS